MVVKHRKHLPQGEVIGLEVALLFLLLGAMVFAVAALDLRAMKRQRGGYSLPGTIVAEAYQKKRQAEDKQRRRAERQARFEERRAYLGSPPTVISGQKQSCPGCHAKDAVQLIWSDGEVEVICPRCDTVYSVASAPGPFVTEAVTSRSDTAAKATAKGGLGHE